MTVAVRKERVLLPKKLCCMFFSLVCLLMNYLLPASTAVYSSFTSTARNAYVRHVVKTSSSLGKVTFCYWKPFLPELYFEPSTLIFHYKCTYLDGSHVLLLYLLPFFGYSRLSVWSLEGALTELSVNVQLKFFDTLAVRILKGSIYPCNLVIFKILQVAQPRGGNFKIRTLNPKTQRGTLIAE